jgi:hypothetical protein
MNGPQDHCGICLYRSVMHPPLPCFTGRWSFSNGYVPPKPHRALRAFRIPASLLLLAPLMLMACGEGGSTTNHPVATQTLPPTVSPTSSSTASPTVSPTPSPIVTTYQLIEGSTISFASPWPYTVDVPTEPLSGTFEVIPGPFPTPIEGNMVFYRVITRIDFQSLVFTVTGVGTLVGVTTPGSGHVTMQVTAAIKGPVWLMGTAPLSVMSGGMINGLQISGDGYSITIVATSE